MSEKDLNRSDGIQALIYTVRSVQVMLDKDLAVLYNVKPIRLREQVKRNIAKCDTFNTASRRLNAISFYRAGCCGRLKNV